MAGTLCIQLAPMKQLDEARDETDDWTGTKNAAARRRAQTRLATRAYRKRKALAKKAAAPSATPEPPTSASERVVECWDVSQQAISVVPASLIRNEPRIPLLQKKVARQDRVLFPLSPDHLITLLQFNVLRATATCRSLISGVLFSPEDCDGTTELFHVVPYPSKPHLIPPALLPTTLQQTVPHADWIDTFPIPEARDRLILAAGTFDEDDLWADVIGGLYEGFPDDEVERRGIVAWSPPWDVSGYEMSEGFMRKWGWILKGLVGPLEATNRWRMQRGLEPVAWEP